MTLRKALFWAHLGCGVVAGLVIAAMSLTGMALAYRNQTIARAERAVAHVAAPAPGAAAQPLGELVRAVRAAQPEARVSGVTVQNDPAAAVLVNTGRSDGYYVDPYTGAIRGTTATAWRGFFQTMEDWHRRLGLAGPNRSLGESVTGACCAAYAVLTLTGLFLWWPAKIGRPRFQVRGKARDWNWHNVVGVWSSPLLLMITFTGIVMAYHWANDLVFKLAGSPVPAAEGPRGGDERRPANSPREGLGDGGRMSEARTGGAPRMKLDYDALARTAALQVPGWDTITIRTGGGRGAGGPGVSVTIKPRDAWPLFATTQLTLDPATGAVLRQEGYETANPGRKARTWIRFLHTGEAWGWVGATLNLLAAIGGVLLVFTGLSLAYRRFFAR